MERGKEVKEEKKLMGKEQGKMKYCKNRILEKQEVNREERKK